MSLFFSLFLSVAGFSQNGVFAKNVEIFPSHICSSFECSDQQEQIWNAMSEDGGSLTLPASAYYAGTCFWGGKYDASAPQHMGLVLDKQGTSTLFAGAFMFHSDSNPYYDIPLDEARLSWERQLRKGLSVEHRTGFSFFDAAPGNSSPVWYWLREDRKNPNYVYLMAFWGKETLGLCDLAKQ